MMWIVDLLAKLHIGITPGILGLLLYLRQRRRTKAVAAPQSPGLPNRD